MNLEGSLQLDTGDGLPSNVVAALFLDDTSSSDPVLYAGTQRGGIALLKVSYAPTWLDLYGVHGVAVVAVLTLLGVWVIKALKD